MSCQAIPIVVCSLAAAGYCTATPENLGRHCLADPEHTFHHQRRLTPPGSPEALPRGIQEACQPLPAEGYEKRVLVSTETLGGSPVRTAARFLGLSPSEEVCLRFLEPL